MGYTRNQHMLSQWFLRNFRSDDTAQSPKEKQRVWAHVVVPTALLQIVGGDKLIIPFC